MDPFSSESELINLHSHYHQGQYQAVLDYDTSSLSESNKVAARVLNLRAQIALGNAEDVVADVAGEKELELQAVGALAEYTVGKKTSAVKAVEKLISGDENETVLVLGATVLQAEGRTEEALTLLAKHQGSLEAVALIVQIQLQQNRTDLAVKEVIVARKWAQDSLLVNLAESWVGMRVGGEKYQQAFYVFEELAQAPSTTATMSLVSQAVAELHLGRYDEAEAALKQALEKEPENPNVIANMLVLSILAGKDDASLLSSLKAADKSHPLLTGLQEKSDVFDVAAKKYSAKVSA